MATTIEGLEKERDFYYDKLREIEIKLQTLQVRCNGYIRCKRVGFVWKILYLKFTYGSISPFPPPLSPPSPFLDAQLSHSHTFAVSLNSPNFVSTLASSLNDRTTSRPK